MMCGRAGDRVIRVTDPENPGRIEAAWETPPVA